MFGHRFYGARYFGPRYWGDGGGIVVPTPPAVAVPGGVRHARFLRRGPKLPWDEPGPAEVVASEVTVAPPKRRRVRMPAMEKIRKEIAPIPIQTVQEIAAPVIHVPELGHAVAKLVEQEEDELLLWLI